MVLEFDFTVRKSFLSCYSWGGYKRQITIPNRLYPQLKRSKILSFDSIRVICPDRRELVGYIYQGWTKGTEYYQIWMHGSKDDCLSHLQLNQKINVYIHEKEDYIEINIQTQ